MLKKFIKIFLIIILFSSCNNKSGTQNKIFNESSDSINNKLEPKSEQLFKNSVSYYDNKQFEESKKELLILKHKFPNSNEITKVNNLLKNIDLEFEKATIQEQLIEKEEREKKKNKFLEATKDLRKKTDDLEGTSWYQDKTSPTYINRNGFYLYIASSSFNYPSLRLKIQFTDDNWLFIKKYQIFIDGTKYSIEPEYDEIKRDNGNGNIWEWLDISVGKDEFEILTAISYGKDVKIRYVSDKYHKDKTLSIEEKKAIKNILDIYSKIGGEIY